MEIKIGEKSFKLRKPNDLDAVLLDGTGCNATETAAQLCGYPAAGRIASALRPFLPEDSPAVAELASLISAAEDPAVLDAVKKLYLPDQTTPALPEQGGK